MKLPTPTETNNYDCEQRPAKRLILCQPIQQSSRSPTNGHGYNSTAPPPPYPLALQKIDSSSSNNTNRAGSRKSRVYYMYKFLTETYPSLISSSSSSSSSNSSTTILDVAGGRGDLSWYLVNAHASIKSIVVDPRPTNHGALCKSARFLEQQEEIRQERSVEGTRMFQPMAHLLPHLVSQRTKRQRKSEQQQQHQQQHEKGRCSSSSTNDVLVNEEGWRVPSNLRIHVDDTLVQTIRHCSNTNKLMSLNDDDDDDDDRSTHWNIYWQKAEQRVESLCQSPRDKLEFDTSSCRIKEANQALETILNASLIVGFHPDQATEAIVDLATWLQIPYCIVPCCVFPSEFPNRTLAVRGEEAVRVRDHKGLIEYLKAKDSNVREGCLEFPLTTTAKNVVLYTLPMDYETCD